MAFSSVAIASLCLTTALAVWQWRRCRLAEAARDASIAREASAMRLLRLAAGDMRGLALTLLGHAQSGPETAGSAISGLGRRLLDLSEDLLAQTEMPGAPRHLLEEKMSLLPVVEFAVAQVAAQLGPGRRAWRIGDGLRDVTLLADRRALNQVLVNVLAGAAAATRDGDWIDISTQASEAQWSLVVEDEGVGLPVPPDAGNSHESRGIGLGLALARSLMHAHGGTLAVDSTARVGTRVRLGFPIARLIAADSVPES